jgi:hypothetical protein
MASDRSSIYAQVNDLANSVLPDFMFTCSRQGQMRIVYDLNIEEIKPGRPSPDNPADVWASWDDSYWTEIHFTYNRNPRVNQTRTMAIVATSRYIPVDLLDFIPVVGSVAPGGGPGQGEQFIQNSERLVFGVYMTGAETTPYEVRFAAAQENLNTYEGNRYARYNSRYSDFLVTIPWEKLNPAIDISEQKYILLTVSEENRTERELVSTFTNKVLLPLEMVINYDYQETGLVRTVVFTLEEYTRGNPAQGIHLGIHIDGT